jgi:hypothetical protein
VSNEKKPNDDRDGELAGGVFCGGSGENNGLVGLKLLLTASGRPHFGISQRWNMSRVAMAVSKGEQMPERFVAFDSKVSAGKDGWETILEMKDTAVMKSCKTCVITGEYSEQIFVLYKVSDNWFGVKCRAPITPFIAFGIALAIINSAK